MGHLSGVLPPACGPWELALAAQQGSQSRALALLGGTGVFWDRSIRGHTSEACRTARSMPLTISKSAQPFDNYQCCCWELGKKKGEKRGFGVFFQFFLECDAFP